VESTSKKRFKFLIQGIVQGVGFRPFIYKLALKYKLDGFVTNDGDGVVIEVEGDEQFLIKFTDELEINHPPLSRIDNIEKKTIKPTYISGFKILKSTKTPITTMLSADISLCDDCLKEMDDKQNRRYKYPFINCTNCGPRYTIINNLPYDRIQTSMGGFMMCKNCSDEYKNPLDRRYHAQPISCYECGPKLSYISLSKEIETDQTKAIHKTLQLIRDGKIVAIKGLGGFHIVCDATNNDAVKYLRDKKPRATKPLAVMFQSIEEIKKVAHLSKIDEKLILSKEKPIVIVKKRKNQILSKLIAPNIDRVGVFLPYTPLHKILLDELKIPIVTTSANLSGEPIILKEDDIFKKLPHLVEHILTHNRDIINGCDDSVLQSVCENFITLRMARGYAPYSFHIKKKSAQKILALGANQKTSITLVFDNHMILSPYIGDLNSIDSFEYFQKVLQTLKRVYTFEPDIIVCDKHPHYETTKFAKQYIKRYPDIKLIDIQHHYAHALSCMAEHNLDTDVLAFCFDGTGYGDDATLWGGEIFVANTKHYKRVYHFKELLLLGGEIAIKEPRRVALSLLFDTFELDEILTMNNKLVNSFEKEEIKNLYIVYKRGINSIKTSSLGRVFDAVYALCGFTKPLSYEGESGIILESISCNSDTKDTYSYRIDNMVIDYSKMIHEILQDEYDANIAKKFINTIVKIILDIAQIYPHLPLVLSGGVFQNRVLVSQLSKELNKINKKYYIQSKIPINDGGISFGQAYFALKNH
jgi:hydrogenase maturation protein HypF